MYDPNDDEPSEYEVEVVKIITYVVKVKAWSRKDAAYKAQIEVENKNPTEMEIEYEVTDINQYVPQREE